MQKKPPSASPKIRPKIRDDKTDPDTGWYNPQAPKKEKGKAGDWPTTLDEFLLDPNFESCW